MKALVETREEFEIIEVSDIQDSTQEYDDDGPYDRGTEFWVLTGLQPSDTRLIPSRFTWLSGSMADPRDGNMDQFPLVYIPKDSDFTVSEYDESESIFHQTQ